MRSISERLGRAFLVVILLLASTARADELPAPLQAALLVKTLAYDHALPTRTPRAATVLVLFKPGDKESEQSAAELTRALQATARTSTVSNLPLRVFQAPFSDVAALETRLTGAEASALYVAPGLSGSLAAISTLTRRKSVLTACASEDALKAGLSLGFVDEGGKPALLVNIAAARAEGARLDAGMLRMARLVP